MQSQSPRDRIEEGGVGYRYWYDTAQIQFDKPYLGQNWSIRNAPNLHHDQEYDTDEEEYGAENAEYLSGPGCALHLGFR